MLALQRPSMGSSKPPSRDMPFGYDFDATNDYPSFPPPPAPAPGPSLLDDNDSRLLDTFFDGISSDQFTSDFFEKPTGIGGSNNYELPFGWQELPPTFMGTSSSYGQQVQQPTHGLSDNGFGLMGSDMPAVTSADVMAATTLLGGHNSNLHNQNGAEGLGLGSDFFSAHDISRTLQTGPSLSMQHRVSLHSTPMTPYRQPQGSANPTAVPQKEDFPQDSYYRDMIFGPTTTNNAPSRTKPEDIQWGSDSGFGAASFIAPPGQESIRRVERSMLKQLDCFTPKLEVYQQPNSAHTTQPSSPITTRSLKEDAAKSRRQSVQVMGSVHREDELGESSFALKKRRKSTSAVKKEEDEDLEDSQKPTSLQTRKRKHTASKSVDSSQPSPAASKRRKSTQTGTGCSGGSDTGGKGKSTRENLTEDQKRENHIRSEQKRRTLIKEGFDDLGELVPELATGGFSKSAVLLMAGDWLQELVEGNAVLRKQLDALEGRSMNDGDC